jgi:hypothetical protein
MGLSASHDIFELDSGVRRNDERGSYDQQSALSEERAQQQHNANRYTFADG